MQEESCEILREQAAFTATAEFAENDIGLSANPPFPAVKRS
jgi:hypothetical protein